MRYIFGILAIWVIMFIVGCGANHVIVGELGPYSGQWSPLMPNVEGGCFVDAGDLTNIEVTYGDGECTVKTNNIANE